MARSPQSRKPKMQIQLDSLEVVNPRAAGIDIGAREHWVAVPPSLSEDPVRSFSALTPGLRALVDWLVNCGITTVVMEATGVYWVPLYEMLEARGLEVALVNARHVRMVPGRKSDVLDCQWLLKLHTFGLLRGSFRPTAEIVELRGYLRQRDRLVEGAAVHVQHMHKALTLMNVQLHTVLSDLTGDTGMAIIRDLVAGQRDPVQLARHRNWRCHASQATIAASLQGNFQREHMLSLTQALALYDLHQQLIADCDAATQRLLQELTQRVTVVRPKLGSSPKRRHKRDPQVDFRTPAYTLTGVDLTAVPGIAAYSAVCLLAEIGTDMSRWASASEFASWLRLAPRANITGGRVTDARTMPGISRAAELLRTAAVCASKTNTAIGAFYRRMTLRHSSGHAVVATAHKLARIIYSMLKHGTAFNPIDEAAYNEQQRQRSITRLQRHAIGIGMTLVPLPTGVS